MPLSRERAGLSTARGRPYWARRHFLIIATESRERSGRILNKILNRSRGLRNLNQHTTLHRLPGQVAQLVEQRTEKADFATVR